MLNTEFGGMNEVLADLYADSGDKRWLNLSHGLRSQRLLDHSNAAKISWPDSMAQYPSSENAPEC
jgi:hypothetical protein